MKRLLTACAIALAGAATAQPPAPFSLDQLSADHASEEQARALLSTVDALKQAAKQVSERRMLACRRAFGNDSFCGCLDEQLPVALSFEEYVASTTLEQDDPRRTTLSANDQKAFARARAARDACVARTASDEKLARDFSIWMAMHPDAAPSAASR